MREVSARIFVLSKLGQLLEDLLPKLPHLWPKLRRFAVDDRGEHALLCADLVGGFAVSFNARAAQLVAALTERAARTRTDNLLRVLLAGYVNPVLHDDLEWRRLSLRCRQDADAVATDEHFHESRFAPKAFRFLLQ